MGRGRQRKNHVKINKCKRNTKEIKDVRAKARADQLHLQAKAGPRSIFVNKVLLTHSHSHYFIYCLWLLAHFYGRAEWLQQKQSGLKHLLAGPL